METVVASDAAMIDPKTLQSSFGEEVRVETAVLDSESAMLDAASEADALIVGVEDEVDASVLSSCEQLQIVARAGVGVENIDVAAAANHGVTVTSVPDYCDEEVPTHAVALLLASVRRLGVYDRAVAEGRWSWTDGRAIHRLSTTTVGFLSFGKLAKHTAERLSGFGCDLVAADPYVEGEEMAEYGVEKVPFDDLLDIADHVSIHAPLTDETHHLFDREAFERMSDNAVVVNVGRGPIVDEDALAWALETGEIAAAGLDVLESDPPESSPLADRDDVILTPHAAFYSEESVTDLNRSLAEDIQAVFEGREPDDVIHPNGEDD